MLPSLRCLPGPGAGSAAVVAEPSDGSSVSQPQTAVAASIAACNAAASSSSCGGRCIADGDLVIVYENPNSMKAVTVSSTGRFDSRFGSFVHKDWIGRLFGSKVYSRGNSGWCYLLAPTPELWTLVLKHRTQILYLADISVVCLQLELSPGARVLESGTGSASLTHSLARAVAPLGHVFSYDFHSERSQEAAKELQANGLGAVTTVTQRDIMELGFPLEAHEGQVDAVFLDLPGPWKVVQNAAACLKPNGRFCSFSPCIEQVQRTCEVLREARFTDIQTIEVLLREHEVRVERLLGGREQEQVDEAVAAGASASAAVSLEGGREGSCAEAAAGGAVAAEGGAAAAEGGAAAEGCADGPQAAGEQAGAGPESGDAEGAGLAVEAIQGSEPAASAPAAKRQKRGGGGEGVKRGAGRQDQAGRAASAPSAPSYSFKSVVTSRPHVEARGHTGYLTFARKFV